MIKLSAIIITYNEERNISRCIESLKDVADEIIVVDSFSADRTHEICIEHGVRFIKNKFEGHIEQKNFALNQASYPYIISLDADEALSDILKTSILSIKSNWNADAYKLSRLTNYCGKWIHHCGWYPDRKLRIAKKDQVRWGGENPRDRLELIHGGKTVTLKGDLLHYSFYSIEEHVKQINKFTDIRAIQMHKKGRKASLLNILISPIFKFFKSYIFKLGFLDGFYGYVVCRNSAYATFLRYIKLHQLNKLK